MGRIPRWQWCMKCYHRVCTKIDEYKKGAEARAARKAVLANIAKGVLFIFVAIFLAICFLHSGMFGVWRETLPAEERYVDNCDYAQYVLYCMTEDGEPLSFSEYKQQCRQQWIKAHPPKSIGDAIISTIICLISGAGLSAWFFSKSVDCFEEAKKIRETMARKENNIRNT